MGNIGIVLVSHSEDIANGLKNLVNEMNDGTVPVIAAGGAEGGRIGTDTIKIQEAIESLEECEHILIYADLGSSVLSANTAIDMLDEDELAEKCRLVNCPLVEGALAGVVQATMTDDVEEVIKVSEDARNMDKI